MFFLQLFCLTVLSTAETLPYSGTLVENKMKTIFYHNESINGELLAKRHASNSMAKQKRLPKSTKRPNQQPMKSVTLANPTLSFGSGPRRYHNDHDGIHVDEDHLAPNWSDPLNHEEFRPDEYKLVRHLLQYYDRRIRPTQGGKRMNVTFGLALSLIIDVDEKNQLITTNCWLNTAWIDFQLTWNPEEWGGIHFLRLPYNLIWLPDILLYNNADVMTYFSAVSTNVIVHYSGNVTWLNMMIYKRFEFSINFLPPKSFLHNFSTCAIDVQYFPFDVQNCSLLFSSWTYDGRQMGIETLDTVGDVSNYIENTEWHLVNFSNKLEVKYFSCCPNDPYPFITFFVVIRRRPLYYVFNLFIPCILITLIALLGFYVPSDSGEKVSMGITTLLSMTVFLMVVAESMPPTKSHVPLLGLYFGFNILIVSCTTALTVLTLLIHHRGKRGIRMPSFMRFIIFNIVAKLLFYTVHLPDGDVLTSQNVNKSGNHYLYIFSKWFCRTERNEDTEEHDGSSDKMEAAGQQLLKQRAANRQIPQADVSHSLAYNVQRLVDINQKQIAMTFEKHALEAEWQQAAAVIDRLILTIFLVTTLGVTFTIHRFLPDEW